MTDVLIKEAAGAADFAAAKSLTLAYFDALRARAPEARKMVDDHMTSHDVEAELDDLSAHFTPPHGACLLARRPDVAVGVVMLSRQTEETCEMNRMFVSDTARGTGLGRALCDAIIAKARAMGFGQMILDTMHFLTEAISLYRSVGFQTYGGAEAYAADDPRILHMRLALPQGASDHLAHGSQIK
ncbi:GNAT family N-acetyltransferase [Thalassococcus sp. S3]|uniref:GNAT family N-acetyltransferase n=1 Tax=Thalassococcus sp. S3 TaxID=2017482 RepID=UPI001024479F|nr:GNAT family N-acetyltransferase [Thalassococcus sp. S3]QBF30594.1 N-acetyltransferase CML5 Camello-like protein 5 [Thalassococcus sp. S3]